MKNYLEEISKLSIKDTNSKTTYPLSEAPIPLLVKIFDTISWKSIER